MERRGRARSETARIAILTAARDLTTENGFAHLTIEKIAARAGVGKPTIYRWWPSKNAILAECVLEGIVLPEAGATVSPDSIGESAGSWFRSVLEYLDEPGNAALLRGLVAASYEDQEISAQLFRHLGAPIEARITAWIKSTDSGGTLGAEVRAAAATQVLFGSILYRLALRGEESDRDATAEVFDIIIAGLQHGSAPVERS